MKRLLPICLLALLTGCTSPSPVKVVTVPPQLNPTNATASVTFTPFKLKGTNVWVPPPAITSFQLHAPSQQGTYRMESSDDLVTWRSWNNGYAITVTSSNTTLNMPLTKQHEYFRWEKIL